jgi:hypothetical protein
MTMSACEDDPGHGDATISFLHPTDNEQIPMAQANNVNIHVRFEWDGSSGEAVAIRLVAENQTNDVILDLDVDQHDSPYEFEQSVNLSSYPVGTEFHLTASACADHDCNEIQQEASIHFTLVE